MNTTRSVKRSRLFVLGLMIAAIGSAPEIMAAAAGRGGGGGGGMGGGMPAASQNRGGGMSQANRPDAMPNGPMEDMGRGNAANGRASAPGQEVAAERRSQTATAALEKTATIRAINQTAFAERRTVIANIRNRVEDCEKTLQQVQEQARLERRDANDDFQAAMEQVRVRRTELEDGLNAANGSNSENWGQRRQELASQFGNYSDAVAAVESAAGDTEE